MAEHWGWLIAIYLFMGGIGAGAYLSSYAAEKGWLGDAESLKRTGYFIAAPIVGLGALLLVFDLGQGIRKPWLILGMFLNPTSVMTWGIYILSAFIGLGLLKAYFAWFRKPAPKILTHLGAVFALATGIYTGMLLAVVQAVPFWNFYLMPVLFIVSALSTGMSATSLLAHFVERGELKEGRLCQAHLLLVGLEIVLLVVIFAWILAGYGGPMAVLAAVKLLKGSLAVVFWPVLVGMGLVGPFLFYIYHSRHERKLVQIELEPSVVISEVDLSINMTKNHHLGAAPVVCACDLAVMVGGLALRCLVVFAALPVWIMP